MAARAPRRRVGRARAAEAATARGAPETLETLQTTVAAGAEDVRRALREIRALQVPEHARGRIEPVRADAREAEQLLLELEGVSSGNDPRAIADVVERIRFAWQGWSDHAEAAGLRECARENQESGLIDALLAPGYRAHAQDVYTWLSLRLNAILAGGKPAATKLERMAAVLEEGTMRLSEIDGPMSGDLTGDLNDTLAEGSEELYEISDRLEGRRPAGSERALARRLLAFARKLEAAGRRLFEARGPGSAGQAA